MSQHPRTCTLCTGVLPAPRLSSLPPTPTHPNAGKGWKGDSVLGNNRSTTPSGPSREKELWEGNSSPGGRGHRPLIVSPAGATGLSFCSRPLSLSFSCLYHLGWLPPRLPSEKGIPTRHLWVGGLMGAQIPALICLCVPCVSWPRAVSMSAEN